MKEQTKSLPHGGDWAGFATECGALPLDFSASVSPLGLPEGVRTAAAQALEKADRYLDPLCRALRRAIAAEEGVAEEMVLCGCGAADLIWRAVGARRPQRALVPAPTFSEYESALRAAHCAVAHSALRRETGFAAGEALLDALTPEVDMAFFCQPNNPTGRTCPRRCWKRCWLAAPGRVFSRWWTSVFWAFSTTRQPTRQSDFWPCSPAFWC